jgi:hypothetical protein
MSNMNHLTMLLSHILYECLQDYDYRQKTLQNNFFILK